MNKDQEQLFRLLRTVVAVLLSQVQHFSNPMDCSLADSSVLGVLQARILEWVAIFPGDLPDAGIEPTSPVLAGGFFITEPPGKPLLRTTDNKI